MEVAGQGWRCASLDAKPRLSTDDIRTLLKYTDDTRERPHHARQHEHEVSQEEGREGGRLDTDGAIQAIALNLHAALRMGIMTTKRPSEISAISRSEINQRRVVLAPYQDLPCW